MTPEGALPVPRVLFLYSDGSAGTNMRVVMAKEEPPGEVCDIYELLRLEWQDGTDAMGRPVWRPLTEEVLALRAGAMLNAMRFLASGWTKQWVAGV